MRKWTLYLILLTFGSCQENDVNKTRALLQGTYTGQFIRSSPNAKYAPSSVTLTFTVGRFSGESDKIKYPAICHGTYKLRGQNIEFQNECPWTAEFDPSYILSGEFRLYVDGDKLEMIKYRDSHTDYYKLTLQ